MPLHHHDSDQQTTAHVALVIFQVAQYWVALEARYVLAMTDQPQGLLKANAQTLLHADAPPHEQLPPDRWLTLNNRQRNDLTSTWQLGVNGDITLRQLPVTTMHPLPPLLQARRFTPALCGVAFDQHQLVLLLDARKLSP
ncbi:hypothetical protein [Halomonas sp. SpR8]|uniref:hypothetical protein n=1 Tax=Halomonas sp. SpR8 TaxID=3050463 RepID=UPI0027E4D1D9|nr:hypothetical protein [Halomonas sp. SpR8]MDQ7729002.1 hypothetical protein [Halomonas sp. SpR8]